jgi:hypothetical protein
MGAEDRPGKARAISIKDAIGRVGFGRFAEAVNVLTTRSGWRGKKATEFEAMAATAMTGKRKGQTLVIFQREGQGLGEGTVSAQWVKEERKGWRERAVASVKKLTSRH